jgi:hypothetical protein
MNGFPLYFFMLIMLLYWIASSIEDCSAIDVLIGMFIKDFSKITKFIMSINKIPGWLLLHHLIMIYKSSLLIRWIGLTGTNKSDVANYLNKLTTVTSLRIRVSLLLFLYLTIVLLLLEIILSFLCQLWLLWLDDFRFLKIEWLIMNMWIFTVMSISSGNSRYFLSEWHLLRPSINWVFPWIWSILRKHLHSSRLLLHLR